MEPSAPDSPTMLFDGVCNLCNASVQTVLKHEKTPTLKFAPLQSKWGKRALEGCGMNSDSLSSVVFIEGGRCFVKSTAVIQISRYMRWPWSMARVFSIVPTVLRDWLYDWVARNRYRWFGKTDACMLMTGEMKKRFYE